jgi:hypothetical protein
MLSSECASVGVASEACAPRPIGVVVVKELSRLLLLFGFLLAQSRLGRVPETKIKFQLLFVCRSSPTRRLSTTDAGLLLALLAEGSVRGGASGRVSALCVLGATSREK